MIVPRYWAEGRVQHRERGRQVTVRRFGWSDVSEADAQASADLRAQEALRRILAGETLRRREPKVAYNGADGVPIREEIVDRRGDAIVTRNAYGARCLNTPNVFFADVDFPEGPGVGLVTLCTWLLMLVAVGVAWATGSRPIGAVLGLFALIFGVWLADRLDGLVRDWRGGDEALARRPIEAFLADRPDWSIRLYRTPAGLRLLVAHRPFSVDDPEVAAFFVAARVDPVYSRLCLRQKCFRARVGAKPWRAGIDLPLSPRPGVWPIAADRLPARQRWVDAYEAAAATYAACRYVETLGSGVVHPLVRSVQQFHDALCRAETDLPIA